MRPFNQTCGWKPYRKLSPTRMAEASPLANNDSAYGKAQGRRTEMNNVASKRVAGL